MAKRASTRRASSKEIRDAEERGRAQERSGGMLGSGRNGSSSDRGGFNDPLPSDPPKLYDSVAEVMRGIIRLIAGVLINSDIAFRQDRDLQRMMRNDPDVMGPLQQRQLAVAMLDYDIVPEDEGDKTQKEQADKIKSLITKHMRRPTDFLRHMSEAVWYGPAGANMIYERVKHNGKSSKGKKRIDSLVAPGQWRPFHSDTLLFTEWGDLGMRVGVRYPGDKVPVWDGLGHLFSTVEREAVVLHTWMPQGPEYEELEHGRYLYAGRGIRDVVWFQWLMKHKALQLWMTWLERYGMGTRVATYPDGNRAGKTEMTTVLRNLLGDVSVLLPDDSSDSANGKSRYSLEVLDHAKGSGGQKVFADLIEGYLAGQIKELIIGQSATTEATNTGLGSDVGTRHAETFWRLIKYDASVLADSLTHEFVHRLHRMCFGETDYMPRWSFSVEDVDSEKFVQGVKAYVEMGGTVSDRQVRERLGFDEPENDEDTLGGQQDMMGMMGQGGPGGPPPGGGPGGAGGQTPPFAGQGNDMQAKAKAALTQGQAGSARGVSKQFGREWDESKHPRADDGKFGEGGGGGSDPTKSSGGRSSASELGVRREANRLFKLTARENAERSALIDPGGKVVARGPKGTVATTINRLEGKVDAPHSKKSLTQESYAPAGSLTHIHSHPNTSSFSDGDWGVYMKSSIGRAVVIGKEGRAFSVTKPQDTKMPTPLKVRDRYNAILEEVEGSLEKAEGQKIDDWVDDVIENTNQQLAEELGWKFETFHVSDKFAREFVEDDHRRDQDGKFADKEGRTGKPDKTKSLDELQAEMDPTEFRNMLRERARKEAKHKQNPRQRWATLKNANRMADMDGRALEIADEFARGLSVADMSEQDGISTMARYRNVLTTMPKAAAGRLLVDRYEHHPDPKEVGEAFRREGGKMKDGYSCGGFYQWARGDHGGTLHANAPDSPEFILAHELGHAMDGELRKLSTGTVVPASRNKLSDTPEFTAAFDEEATDLSDYGSQSRVEHFAEMCRALYAPDPNLAGTKDPGAGGRRKAMRRQWKTLATFTPKTWAFFKERGLLPDAAQKIKARTTEEQLAHNRWKSQRREKEIDVNLTKKQKAIDEQRARARPTISESGRVSIEADLDLRQAALDAEVKRNRDRRERVKKQRAQNKADMEALP